MKNFDVSTQLLMNLFGNAEQDTLNYILSELTEIYGDNAPDENAVKNFLLSPDSDTLLSSQERVVVIDKVLERAEINFRTTCDLIRYRFMKDAGMVHSMDEFLALFHSDDNPPRADCTASSGRVRPCVRSCGAGRECTRSAAWTRCAAVVGHLWGAQTGVPIEAQRSGFDGERRSKGAQWGMLAGRFPRSGLCSDEGHRRDAPLGRMPTLLGGASIASGYTPPALAGALPRHPPAP